MLTVQIALLKASLAKYLRMVRNGREVVILDRTHPIAKIVPFIEATPFKLEVIRASADPKGLANIKGFRQRGIHQDVVELLLEDRRAR